MWGQLPPSEICSLPSKLSLETRGSRRCGSGEGRGCPGRRVRRATDKCLTGSAPPGASEHRQAGAGVQGRVVQVRRGRRSRSQKWGPCDQRGGRDPRFRRHQHSIARGLPHLRGPVTEVQRQDHQSHHIRHPQRSPSPRSPEYTQTTPPARGSGKILGRMAIYPKETE